MRAELDDKEYQKFLKEICKFAKEIDRLKNLKGKLGKKKRNAKLL